ncbi:MAG: hypothetical protein WCR83_06685 [Candidatus Methanomethylophilaceae archaeon]
MTPDASITPKSLDDLTEEEKYIVSRALSEPYDLVNLPVVIESYSHLKAQKTKTPSAIRSSIYRAAKRLNSRGLAEIEKYGGMIWVHVPRYKIARLIIRDRQQNANLCERKVKA